MFFSTHVLGHHNLCHPIISGKVKSTVTTHDVPMVADETYLRDQMKSEYNMDLSYQLENADIHASQQLQQTALECIPGC